MNQMKLTKTTHSLNHDHPKPSSINHTVSLAEPGMLLSTKPRLDEYQKHYANPTPVPTVLVLAEHFPVAKATSAAQTADLLPQRWRSSPRVTFGALA